jgi:hypothetical protein
MGFSLQCTGNITHTQPEKVFSEGTMEMMQIYESVKLRTSYLTFRCSGLFFIKRSLDQRGLIFTLD